jgi:hypothetical protein
MFYRYKKDRTKTIKFTASTREVDIGGSPPQPAVKSIPEWYKNINQWTNGDKKLKHPLGSQAHNASIKRCLPFIDAMSAGYIFSLDDDVYVELLPNGEPHIRWKSDVEMITWHSTDQWAGVPIPDEYHPMVAKWHNEWQINTPKGYSLWATHPANRFDLPFQTLTGFVDTDTYDMGIHFPFFLKKGFEGIIPAGTPLAQLIPIKRDNFKSEKEEYNLDNQYKKKRVFWRTFAGSYKVNYWTKKKYQ